jgi:hypothetical protein
VPTACRRKRGALPPLGQRLAEEFIRKFPDIFLLVLGDIPQETMRLLGKNDLPCDARKYARALWHDAPPLASLSTLLYPDFMDNSLAISTEYFA